MNPLPVPVVVLGLLGAILVVGLFIWAMVRQARKAKENIRQLAGTLGLQFEEVGLGGAVAGGQLRGKLVAVFSFTTGSGKSSCQWCAVSAKVPVAGPLTFRLRRQGLGTKFMEFFGAKEITVGDAEFDRTWFVQTNQPEFLREALLPELREKINVLVRELGTQAQGMEFKLEKDVVRYAEIGSFANGDSCKRCLRAADIVCDLADVAEVFAEQQPAK